MQRLAGLPTPKTFVRVFISAAVVLNAAAAICADEPLHARIDRIIDSRRVGPDVGECSDAEFLRRVSLDLNGIIPTADAARAYLNDASPDKRRQLVERTLNDPRYARHLANVLDVMLMERRKATHVKSPEWEQFLFESVAADKPFNQLAREILSADGTDEKNRAAARFYLDREGEPHLLTRDVGRIFFGRDFQCAQCHDHPLIEDYLQHDYYGLFAFFTRTSLFTDKKAKKSFLAETADGEAVFTSVFTDIKGQTRPRLPTDVEIDEPVIPAAETYLVKPAKDVRPVPKFSRRAALAEKATDGSNRAFNRNIVNRLWAHMMGRGLVEPVDLHHPGNPPTHPQLLDLLADEFVAMNFDIKAFLRELALTKTYRRAFDMPSDMGVTPSELAQRIEQLKTDQDQRAAALEAQSDKVTDLRNEVDFAQLRVFDAETEEKNAAKALAAAQKAQGEAAKKLAELQQALDKQRANEKLFADALAKADEVVKQFPDDKEIAAAAETYRARVKKTADEIAAIMPALEQQTAAVKAAETKTAAAQEVATAAQQKLAEAQQKLQQMREPYYRELFAYRAARTRSQHEAARLKNLRTLAAYNKAVAEQPVLAADVATAREAVTAVQTAGSQASEEVTVAQEALAAPQQAHAAAAAEAADIRAGWNEHHKLTKQVTAAAAAGQAALAALPDDAELKASSQKLQGLAEQLQAEAPPLKERLQAADDKLAQAETVLKAAQQTVAAAIKKQAQAEQAVASANEKLQSAMAAQQANQVALDEGRQQLVEQSAARFATSSLKPLTPEQLGWSIMQATGVIAQQRDAVEKELEQQADLKPDQRELKAEATLHDKLNKQVAAFVKVFGAGAGQPQDEFFATVDQSLFFVNGGQVQGWLNPGGDNLTGRLQSHADPAACAEELYLATLTRKPTAEETKDVTDYLAGVEKDQRSAAVQELAWALLTSAEFRFQH